MDITKKLGKPYRVDVDWELFISSDTVFLWEAFVTSTSKGNNHDEDASIAIKCFQNSLPELNNANAINEPDVLSLVGAAVLRAGWSSDLSILSNPCVVIKA